MGFNNDTDGNVDTNAPIINITVVAENFSNFHPWYNCKFPQSQQLWFAG